MLNDLARRTFVKGVGATAMTGFVGSNTAAATDVGTDQSEAQSATFTAASFNIRYDNPEDEYTWEERRGRVVDTITELGPDLLGLQEVLANQYDYLRESVEGYSVYGVGRADGDREGEFVPIAWREDQFEPIEQGEFWLSETPTEPSIGWDADLPRVTTWASLRHRETGMRVWLCNTHLSHIGETARAESAQLLRERAKERAANGEQVVMTGDFNVDPTQPPYEILMGTAGNAESPLFDPRREATTDTVYGPWGTYQGFSDRIGDRIDYVFTLDTAHVNHYRTLDVQPDAYRSDHLPVITEFEYSGHETPGPATGSEYYQVDFIGGGPIEELSEEGLYAEQDRLLRYAWGETGDGIANRGSAWASEEIRNCLASHGHITHANGEAAVSFTVADGCEMTLSLAVHSMPNRTFDTDTADQQALLDAATETFGPGEHTLSVPVPTKDSSD